jgi:hypothetical protein
LRFRAKIVALTLRVRSAQTGEPSIFSIHGSREAMVLE